MTNRRTLFGVSCFLFLDLRQSALLRKDSFVHFRGAILTLNDTDADKPQKMLNRQTTLRGSSIMTTGHFGEHLGQSIAFARMNGVVPPWTEEAQQQQQKPGDRPKPGPIA